MSSKKKKIKSDKKPLKVNIDFSLPLNNTKNIIIVSSFFIISACLAYYYIYWSFSINKDYSFPLDDPWIHLTFARNLIEFGSYSYFKNEMVTAGSTSPIYTLILALGYIFIKNEFILSYSLGILFFSLTALTIYKLTANLFKENWLGIIAVLIFVLDRWMNYFADSGMETTCYIFLLIITYYFYIKRKPLLFGFALGLTLWTRPDAFAFIAAVIADYLLFLYCKKKSNDENKFITEFTKPELIKIAVVFAVVISAYFAMNMMLSGTMLPNTYSAKTVYYTPEFRSRTDFLKYEVWGYFTNASYIMIIFPFLFGVIKIAAGLYKRSYNYLLLSVLFVFLLIFLYWYKLPFAAVKGRYLVPVIPFYILVFVYGTREIFKAIASFINDKKIVNAVCIAFFTVTIVYTGAAYSNHKTDYSDQTHRIAIRNYAAAKWINENTPENSVIATHDIGAIGFYTKRRIVDVAGLISPQFTPKLFDPDFAKFVTEEMKRQNVNYIAFMKEWYLVSNQNQEYQAGDNTGEVIYIYKFDANKTHLVGRDVSGGLQTGMEYISNKQLQQAQSVFSKIVVMDPQLSIAYYYLAYTYSAAGNFPIAEKNLVKALELFPEYKEAIVALIDTYKREHKTTEAKNYLNNYLKSNPSDSTASKLLSSIQDTTGVNK